MGIWGWVSSLAGRRSRPADSDDCTQSYGGYLTSKVIETNTSVFTLGMSVAPVTDWRYYDTICSSPVVTVRQSGADIFARGADTERYMSTPQLNPEGYRNSSVMKMEGFKHADFALAHGSGDDNGMGRASAPRSAQGLMAFWCRCHFSSPLSQHRCVARSLDCRSCAVRITVLDHLERSLTRF